jgi:hypothetical protein
LWSLQESPLQPIAYSSALSLKPILLPSALSLLKWDRFLEKLRFDKNLKEKSYPSKRE